jgi:hypothetical protein
MFESMEIWLKGTIPGIIILGGLGSLLALAIVKIVIYLVDKIVPLPYQLHRKSRYKQAYFLGGMHASMYRDESNKLLISFVAFHFLLFIISLALLFAFIFSFSLAIAMQSAVALTIGTFFTATATFLSLYWCYHEFEYIYRTYLTHWKGRLESLEKSFSAREESRSDEEPNKKIKEDAA